MEPPGFATRTRPTWCFQHIDQFFIDGGLEPLAPFVAPNAYRMSRCLACGFEGHYRFAYVLQKREEGHGEKVCRACYWRSWAAGLWNAAFRDAVDINQIRAMAEQKGWVYMGPLTDPSLEDDPHKVQCPRCGKIEAMRPGDIGWGCTCKVNPAPRRQWTGEAPPGEDRRLSPELLSQWHPSRNTVSVAKVLNTSRRRIWWRDPRCGYEWQQTPYDRQLRERLLCPQCETILNSLGCHFPRIAAEWAPENPLTPWQVSPGGKTWFLPAWLCSQNPDHRWKMSTVTRTTGAGNCPICLPAGSSRIEHHYLRGARELFGSATGGRKTVTNGGQIWYVDITVERNGKSLLMIEYDGSFWHKENHELDTRKFLALLELGATVVRLRETPLGTLGIRHPRYLEIEVDSSPNAATGVLERIAAWTTQQK